MRTATATQISRVIAFSHLGPGGAVLNRTIRSLSRPSTVAACSRELASRPRPLPLTPLQGHRGLWMCPVRAAACFQRGLMTQSDGHEPVLRYSGDNEHHVSPQEYKLRVGTAIRTLREELPQFFQHGLCTTSIYASNIRLIEASHTNVTLQGKPIYLLLAGAVRWSFKMWFRDIEFEIQSIRVNDRGGRGLRGMDSGGDFNGGTASASTSTLSYSASSSTLHLCMDTQKSPSVRDGGRYHVVKELLKNARHNQQTEDTATVFYIDGMDRLDGMAGPDGGMGGPIESDGDQSMAPPATTVTVRWTMKGTTRPSVVLTSSGPTPPPPSSYAGVFVYQFDDRGLIDEHRIENIMPSPSPEAIQRAFAWWGWLLSRTRPAAAAASDEGEARKRLGLECIANK